MVCYKIVCTCMTQVSYKLSHGLFFDIHLLVYVSIDIWILKSLRHHSAVYTLKYTRYTSNIRKNERYTEIYLGNTSISVVVKAELYKFINIMILLSFFFFYYRYPSFRFLLHIVTHRYPYRRYHFSYFAPFRHFIPQ